MKSISTGLVILCVLIAGCTESGPAPSEDPKPSTPPPQDPPETPIDPVDPPSIPDLRTPGMAVNDCQAWLITQYYAPGQHPATAPPDWEAENDLGVRGVNLYAWECQRINFGPFERGPVRIVVEAHDNFMPPAECREGNGTFFNAYLSRLLVDDADIANFMHTMHGLPASYAEFDATVDAAAVVSTYTWTWDSDGGVSVVSVIEDDQQTPADLITTRFLWRNGTQAGWLHTQFTNTAPIITDRLATWQLAPPMLMASNQTEAGTGSVLVGSWSATIQQFEDSGCASKSWPSS